MSWYQRFRQRMVDDPRFSRVMKGSFSALMARVLTILVAVVTLPLTLHYLGQLEYGIWVTISTSVVMLSVLDLGIANTLTNFIAEAYAEDDRPKAQQYFATAFWVVIGIVLLLVPAAFAVWRVVNWGSLFHLTDPALVKDISLCVAIAGVFFLLSLPLGLAQRVVIGYQETHFANYFAIANSLFGLFAIVLTVLLHGSIVTLVVAYSMAMLIGPLGLNLWLCFYRRPWIKPFPGRIAPHLVRRLFGQGFLFFVLQLTGLVVFNSDNIVIAHYLGASAVTPYSVAWRLTQYAYVVQNLLIPSLWPAFTEAYHKRQMDWINRTYRALNRKVLSAVGIAAIVIGLGGRLLIRLWVGPMAVPPQELLWLMAAFAFVSSVTTNQALLLTATGRLRLEAGVAVLAAAANLLLSIYLVQRIGVDGVILSTIISFLICMLLPQAWEVRRVLRGHYLPQPVEPTADIPTTSAPPHNDSLAGMGPRILAVLVLYRLSPEQSPAFCTLQALLAKDAETTGKFACVLYDNSPDPHSVPATPFPCLYRHDPTNPGLARPYQYGLDHALSAQVPWLLLLDQDTIITAEYLREALAMTEQVASDGDIVAIVPKLFQGEEMLSPHWPQRHPNPEPLHRKYGLLDQKMKIFNSGSVLRVAALAKIEGFPSSFPLDYLDHVVFHQLQSRGGRVYLMHASLQHSLSCLQIDRVREFRTSYRTRLTLNAESRYYKQFGTRRERILYFLRRSRLGLRMIVAGEFRGALSLLRHSLYLSRIAPDRSVRTQTQR